MPQDDLTPIPLLLTPEQVAELLQVEVASLRRWVTEGRVPFHRVGRKTRFTRADVDTIIDTAQVAPLGSVDHGSRSRRRRGRSA
jgi:excisionase family DNA binding protein